jgi:uncharacterized protein YbjQ (UPF0145 family)
LVLEASDRLGSQERSVPTTSIHKVLGASVFRYLFGGLRHIVGGRYAGYERSLRPARETAMGEMVAEAEQMGADAVIGVDVDYESIQMGQGGSMLMVSDSGTAVKL